MIDASEPKIFERPGAERFEQAVARDRGIDLAFRHLIEQILKLFV